MSAQTYSPRRHLILGFMGVALLLGVLGGWGAFAQLSGAVIATGVIEVESNRQVVEHDEGGIVSKIHVRDGDFVQAGAALLTLDDQRIRSSLQIIEGQLFAFLARQGRLMAERDQADAIVWPSALSIAEADNPRIKELKTAQANLRDLRAQNLRAEVDQLSEQVRQLDAQIEGIEAQLTSSMRQADLLDQELADAQALFEKGLAQSTRVTTLEREAAKIDGDIGRFQSEAAQVRTRQSELEIGKLRLFSARQEEALTELRELEPQINELRERRFDEQSRLQRLVMRAPVSGTVFGSQIFANNSVISAGEPILYVVPGDQRLIVSARIDAVHIDQVTSGQSAVLRFSSFDQRFTPEIKGDVLTLSADIFVDEATGQQYYEAELAPREEELVKLGDQRLIPGLPVEVFIQTGDRTPIHYLTKPLTDYFSRAWRES
ncbi:MAG: HlyD family type I secretion periplasmic adaptor subunit [Pseudomonadota bacterium]